MKKLSFISFVVMVIALMSLTTDAKTNEGFVLPPNAKQIGENVYYLGKKTDPHLKKEVDGLAILHYKKEAAKSSGSSKGGKVQCYGFIATGAKWKNLEGYAFNPANSHGLDVTALFNNFESNVSKWETAANADIVGPGFQSDWILSLDTQAPDGVNEVYFGTMSQSNLIAVTSLWGTFAGPTEFRDITEWDMVFNDVDYGWSLTGEASKMDFENIATHELGHTIGLADMYNSRCTSQTMYGYAGLGETIKRTLDQADILGIRTLYK